MIKFNMKISWVYLIAAGLLETLWSISVKYSNGFTKLVPSIFTLSLTLASYFLFSLSIRTIPLGIAYSVWVGIGIVGTVIVDILLFDEKANFLKLLFIAFIIVGVIGLQLFTKD
jgi:quaternary ammonium compound-resistance protein SugE